MNSLAMANSSWLRIEKQIRVYKSLMSDEHFSGFIDSPKKALWLIDNSEAFLMEGKHHFNWYRNLLFVFWAITKCCQYKEEAKRRLSSLAAVTLQLLLQHSSLPAASGTATFVRTADGGADFGLSDGSRQRPSSLARNSAICGQNVLFSKVVLTQSSGHFSCHERHLNDWIYP